MDKYSLIELLIASLAFFAVGLFLGLLIKQRRQFKKWRNDYSRKFRTRLLPHIENLKNEIDRHIDSNTSSDLLSNSSFNDTSLNAPDNSVDEQLGVASQNLAAPLQHNKNERRCGACVHWGGRRQQSSTPERIIFDRSDIGYCNHPHGQYKGQSKTAGSSCSYWERMQ